MYISNVARIAIYVQSSQNSLIGIQRLSVEKVSIFNQINFY